MVADSVERSDDISRNTMTSPDNYDVTSASDTLAADNDVIQRSHCTNHHAADVECRLELKELWDKFHKLGTEMIITKSGRCAKIISCKFQKFVNKLELQRCTLSC